MAGPAPRPGILDIAPYVPGDAHADGAGRLIRLASNENPLGPSPHVVAAIRAVAPDQHRYPDGGSVALAQALGALHGLDPARIVCGAGSDELLGLIALAYAGPGDQVLHTVHGFLVYPIAARVAGATPMAAPERALTADVDALLARVTERTRIVFLANPNNPTGTWLPADELERLRAGLPDRVLLVIDAAYAEYVTEAGYEPGIRLVDRHDSVVMTRTFSKIYGLAGLRLGWAYGPPAVIDALHRVRGPFNVGAVTQAAGLAAIADQDHVARARAVNTAERARLTERLGALGLTVHPSVANFVLVSFGDAAAADAVRTGLKARGILVRQMGGYGLPDCLRITTSTTDETTAVIDAITDLRQGGGGDG